MEQVSQCLMLRYKVKRQAWLDWIWGHLCSGNILATRTVLVEVLWSWQVRAVHAFAWNILQTQRRQRLQFHSSLCLPPRTKPHRIMSTLDCYSHNTDDSPVTTLWHRLGQREREMRGKEGECQLDLSKPHFRFWVVGRIQLICRNNTDYTTSIRLDPLRSASFSGVCASNSISALHLCLIKSFAFSCSVSQLSGRQTKILIKKITVLLQLLFMLTWEDNKTQSQCESLSPSHTHTHISYAAVKQPCIAFFAHFLFMFHLSTQEIFLSQIFFDKPRTCPLLSLHLGATLLLFDTKLKQICHQQLHIFVCVCTRVKTVGPSFHISGARLESTSLFGFILFKDCPIHLSSDVWGCRHSTHFCCLSLFP